MRLSASLIAFKTAVKTDSDKGMFMNKLYVLMAMSGRGVARCFLEYLKSGFCIAAGLLWTTKC